MQIAQQQLSVTRAQQAAAQEYQDALSATKLVWDSGNEDSYDLSYDILMRPSALNEYDPYLITDSQGKIVLSTNMFNAAVAAGVIDAKTGDPLVSRSMGTTSSTNDGSRNAFLYQLGVYNQADASTIEAIYKLGEKGYTNSGVGGEIIDKTLANSFTTNAFIHYMQNATYGEEVKDETGAVLHGADDAIYGINLVDLLGGETNICTTTSPDSDKDKNKIIITKNGVAITDMDELSKLTLGDLLEGSYEMTGLMSAKDLSDKAIALLGDMAKTLGQGEAYEVKGLSVDEESYSALNNALEFTKALLNSTQTSSSDGKTMYSSVTNAISVAQNTNNIVQGSNNITSVSLSNLLKSYLTYFAISMEGYDYGLYVDAEDSAKSFYVTDDISYSFVISNDNAMTEQDALNADFYNMLYNQLCMNGASSDVNKQQQVTDPDYLTHALKNGQLFISTLNNDGYFYQGHYTSSGHVVEVNDDDAVAQAEAEYNATKSELTYKEQSLEVQMKTIDTELSALTTEYDTVKNLINKNVEKVFTMFST